MQRAYHHHQMAGSMPATGAYQGYAPPSYHYSSMQDYLPAPMSHHSQLGAVTTMSPHMTGSGNHMSSHMGMASHGLHAGQGMAPRASPLSSGLANECIEYSAKPEWRVLDTSKFQML